MYIYTKVETDTLKKCPQTDKTFNVPESQSSLMGLVLGLRGHILAPAQAQARKG